LSNITLQVSPYRYVLGDVIENSGSMASYSGSVITNTGTWALLPIGVSYFVAGLAIKLLTMPVNLLRGNGALTGGQDFVNAGGLAISSTPLVWLGGGALSRTGEAVKALGACLKDPAAC
jgi:hypothetical protein